MKTFLEYVADDLLEKYGDDLSQLTVVFPNKRASLFLNSYLARRLGKPIWSPRYMTISDLFREQTTLQVADPIKLVCELHKSYVAVTGIDETLDHFYGWGQLLLTDFDDIDKQMANADKVLANLRDLHELDDVAYLTEEQKAIIKKFFSNFSDDHTSLLKERFLKLWSRMAAIYHDFNRRLQAQGLAYEGALYRAVVNEVVNSFNSFIFIGFNVLQEVERSLFTYLKKEGKARFYWDFDRFYMKEHEAGHFMRQNLADFPNELDMEDADIYDCFKKEKHITFVSAPTENVQARYVSQWLRNGAGNDGVRTAVVLCDEQLLPMVVHCLPAEVGKANITTGYPLIQSPVASLITQLFNLKTQGYQPSRDRYRLRHVNAMLRHPYIGGLSPEIPRLQEELNTQKVYYPTRQQLTVDEATTLLFGIYEVKGDEDNRSANSGTPLSAILQWMCDVLQLVARSMAHEPQPSVFEQESLFHGYTLLNRLLGLVNDGDLLVDIITLQRLVGQLIQTSSIPFHGEPAEGVQVMGVLETRNLDFDHVLLLSCNEGNMPRGVNDTSFIPYSIRKTYGLTTIDHKVAIFSYYFHRLLQRAGDVTILYNNATTDGHTGEMSRFMLQLMVEDPHHQIAFKTLRAGQAFTPFRPQAVEKTEEVMQRLLQRFVLTDDRSEKLPLITPTAINRYMRCPLLFYYTYAYNLREPDINDDDTIDNRIFGNIFHEAARLIYTRLMEKSHQILATDIEWLLRTKVDIERAVDEAIRAELFSMRGAKDNGAATDNHGQGRMHVELNGLQLINRAVIIHYLRQLLDIDRRLAPFTIIGLETDVVASMTLNINSSQPTKLSSLTPLTTSIGGRIDRLDRIVKDGQECVRVIDYKTGSHQPRPLSGVEAIFRQESLDNHSDYYLQTLLYSSLVSEQQQRLLHTNHPLPVAPALLFIQHAGGDDYDPILKFGKEPISDIAPYKKEFGVLLRQTLDEMFNPALPFVPTADKSRCTNCPYKLLCT